MTTAGRAVGHSARNLIWIAWERHRRSVGLAHELAIPLYAFVSHRARPVRYTSFVSRTICLLLRERPRVLVVQNPSVVLALLGLWLRPLFGYRLIVDAHNAAIRPDKDTLGLLSHICGYVQRGADRTIVTNEALALTVEANGGRAVVLPDPIPTFGYVPMAGGSQPRRITYICSFAADEPWREAIEAVGQLPRDVILQVTGDPTGHIPRSLLERDPRVRFTGYLPDSDYLKMLSTSDVVMDLTRREDCLVCGAYEAIAVGVPLVLSDTIALRTYFRRGVVYTRNEPKEIATALVEALTRCDFLRMEILSLRQQLRVERLDRLATLLVYLENT